MQTWFCGYVPAIAFLQQYIADCSWDLNRGHDGGKVFFAFGRGARRYNTLYKDNGFLVIEGETPLPPRVSGQQAAGVTVYMRHPGIFLTLGLLWALLAAAAPVWEAGELTYPDGESELSAFVNLENPANTQLQAVMCTKNTGYAYRFTLLLPGGTPRENRIIQAGINSDTLTSSIYAEISGNSLEFQIDQDIFVSLTCSPGFILNFEPEDAKMLGVSQSVEIPMAGAEVTVRKVASECTALCINSSYQCEPPLVSAVLWPEDLFRGRRAAPDFDELCTYRKNERWWFNNSPGCRLALDRFYKNEGIGPLSFVKNIFAREGSHFSTYEKLWNQAVEKAPRGVLKPEIYANSQEWYLLLYSLVGTRKLGDYPRSREAIIKLQEDPTTLVYHIENRYELESLKYVSVLLRRLRGSVQAVQTVEQSLREWHEFYREFCNALPLIKQAQALRPLVYRQMLLRVWRLAGSPGGIQLKPENAFRQGTDGKTISGELLESNCSFFDGAGGEQFFFASDACIRGVGQDLVRLGLKNERFAALMHAWDAFSSEWRQSVFFSESIDDAVGEHPRSGAALALLSLFRIYGFGDYFLLRQCLASRDQDICGYEADRAYTNYQQEVLNRISVIAEVSEDDALELKRLDRLWREYYAALTSYVEALETSGKIPAWRGAFVRGIATVTETNAMLSLNYEQEKLPADKLESGDF